jgi:hypothetical protein
MTQPHRVMGGIRSLTRKQNFYLFPNGIDIPTLAL